jgi:hypothetical protein
MTRLTSTALVLLAGLGACGGDGKDYETGICLTDEQICSLELGVTKKDDVVKRFGNPSQSSTGTSTNPSAFYTCVRLDGAVEAYSQAVYLWFDSSSVLEDVDVTRGGRDAKPLPACVQKLKKAP